MTEQQMTVRRPADLQLAQALAAAVCQVPGVLEMSAGRFAREGTYGPGAYVRGVVLHRPTPATLEVAVHVVVAAEALLVSAAGLEGSAALPHLGEQIRAAVIRALPRAERRRLAAVHVSFDDLR